jgi:catechol 2,3-dioxygenase-like lactoylglutathione lyase family enzyme
VQPRIHVLTLAVDDLDRAVAFYRDGLGLETPSVVGTEFTGDDAIPAGAVAMFELQGGSSLPCTRAPSGPRTPTSRSACRAAARSASATRSPTRPRSTRCSPGPRRRPAPR